MPAGSGRKQAAEWNEVTKVDQSSKVMCTHCQTEISCKIERIKAHLAKCNKRLLSGDTVCELECETRPRSESMILDDGIASTSSTMVSPLPRPTQVLGKRPLSVHEPSSAGFQTQSCDFDESASESSSSSSFMQSPCSSPSAFKILKPKKRYQTTMQGFTIRTSESQQKEIDKSVARFVFGNNIPFSAIENKQTVAMFAALRPGYKPPNRKQLAGPLLDIITEELDETLKVDLKDASVTLLQDGWSNIRNDPLTASSIHTGFSSYLLNLSDSGSAKKTAEHCVDIAVDAIEYVKKTYDKEVFAICTDNENKMKKMKELLQLQYPKLLTYGCSAHYLNLVEKEVTPSTVMRHVVEVQKYFRNHHQPHGWLREKDGLMPQLPNDTRWNSQNECIRTFVENFHKYNEIRTEHTTEFDQNIGLILGNIAIYKEAQNLQNQLHIVSCSLDKLQREDATLSTAVEVWLDLLESPKLQPYRKEIQKRLDQALEPFHFLCYMMDPHFNGHLLLPEQEELAECWIMEHKPHFLPCVLGFRIKDKKMYPPSLFEPSVVEQFSSAKWWKLMETKNMKAKTLPSDFCYFFWQLSCCPASSASIERVFSTYGLVWSKLRNRLGAERTTKLVRVYRHLREEVLDW